MFTFISLLALTASPAHATEVVWEGFYRARGDIFSSLSLSDTNEYAEGTSAGVNDRFSVRPSWLLSEHAALHAQLDLYPYTLWGQTTADTIDPLTGDPTAMADSDGVATESDSLVAVRAWGEAITPYGHFSAGRMPMEWGAGILWNAGNTADSRHGDTATRVQWSHTVQQVFVLAAWDQQHEGFLNASDDMQSASLAFGYRSETAGFGLLNSYRYQPSMKWSAYTGDVWGFAQIGPLRAELEAVGKFGGGNLETGANDITQMAFGAMINASMQADKLGGEVEFGVAGGDVDPDDKKEHTFTFDSNHDIALLLFEEPMPTLASKVANDSNGGRTYDAALTGNGISNAIYLHPSVHYNLLPNVQVKLAWTTATLAKGPAATDGRHGYGNEFDLSLRYDPFPHLWVRATGAVMLPGKFYSKYENIDLGGGFDKPAFGGQVVGTVEF